jgi:hypothetical protein
MSMVAIQNERWVVVHEALERNGKQRAALDADEARWLREAEQLQIWKPFALVNMVDYLERTLGYTPRRAHPLCQRSCRLDLPKHRRAARRDALELRRECPGTDGPSHDWSESGFPSRSGKRDRHPTSNVIAVVSRGR